MLRRSPWHRHFEFRFQARPCFGCRITHGVCEECRARAETEKVDALTKAQVDEYLKSVSIRAVFQMEVDEEEGPEPVCQWRGLFETAKKHRITTLQKALTTQFNLSIACIISLEPCDYAEKRAYTSLRQFSSELRTRAIGPYFWESKDCEWSLRCGSEKWFEC